VTKTELKADWSVFNDRGTYLSVWVSVAVRVRLIALEFVKVMSSVVDIVALSAADALAVAICVAVSVLFFVSDLFLDRDMDS